MKNVQKTNTAQIAFDEHIIFGMPSAELETYGAGNLPLGGFILSYFELFWSFLLLVGG